jgi:opacity protein-like surface antigen
MRLKFLNAGFKLIAFAGLGCLGASAQTDVGLSLYGAFSQKTTGNGVAVSPSNSAGGLFELRHLANPIVGFEATYSFNRANRDYSSTVAITCPINSPTPCPPPQPATRVAANAHEVTVDWVPSVKLLNFRPFGVLGAGLLLDVPSGGQTSTQTSTKAVYVYGAGLDWGLLPHLGLRLQYRGNLYKSPDVTKLYTSADAFTHTAEPMIGVYFRL